MMILTAIMDDDENATLEDTGRYSHQQGQLLQGGHQKVTALFSSILVRWTMTCVVMSVCCWTSELDVIGSRLPAATRHYYTL